MVTISLSVSPLSCYRYCKYIIVSNTPVSLYEALYQHYLTAYSSVPLIHCMQLGTTTIFLSRPLLSPYPDLHYIKTLTSTKGCYI